MLTKEYLKTIKGNIMSQCVDIIDAVVLFFVLQELIHYLLKYFLLQPFHYFLFD